MRLFLSPALLGLLCLLCLLALSATAVPVVTKVCTPSDPTGHATSTPITIIASACASRCELFPRAANTSVLQTGTFTSTPQIIGGVCTAVAYFRPAGAYQISVPAGWTLDLCCVTVSGN